MRASRFIRVFCHSASQARATQIELERGLLLLGSLTRFWRRTAIGTAQTPSGPW